MADTAAGEAGSGSLPLSALRLPCLCLAVIVYAVWGAPTPDYAGPAEILIGLLLLIAAGGEGAGRVLMMRESAGWRRAGALLLFYGLSVPVVTGLAHNNSVEGISRDIIPFLFLLLPLFVQPFFGGSMRNAVMITACVAVLGIAFSLRVLLPYVGGRAAMLDPFLLANAPTVLFTAIMLTGSCGVLLFRGDMFKSAILFFLSLLPLAAMALITQRASIGYYGLTVMVLIGVGLWHRPLRMVLPLFMIAMVAAVYLPFIASVAAELWQKNQAVGFNMRWQEAQAVMDELGASPLYVIFGKGWGATVASPAVGGSVVNFTHSLITTYWLKAGLCGLVLAGFYLAQFGVMLVRMFPVRPVMALALGGPFLIDVLLYASFKSLDFGFLLLLITLWAVPPRLSGLQDPDRTACRPYRRNSSQGS